MRARSRRLRGALLLAVGTSLTCAAALLTLVDPLSQLELDTVDARFAIRGPQPAPRDVVVVHIDDATFDALDEQWPFPRRMHAGVIDELRRAGARVIAYDVQFTEPTTMREDNALINAVDRAHGRVVLAATEVTEHGTTDVFGGPETVQQVGARVGNALLPLDSDGVYRRFPYAIEGLASFPVVAVEAAERRRLPRDGSQWIDYRGPPGTIRAVSFSDVLQRRADRGLFRNRVVVVGPSAPSLQDIHATSSSADSVMSGAEVHANAISTLLRGTPLREPPAGLGVVLALLLGMLAPLASLKLRRPRGPIVAAAGGVAYVAATQLAFEAGVILPLIYPMTALVASLIGVLVVEYAAAAFERDRVRELFARFVPEGMVSEVIAATGDDLRLVGKREDQSTVLFCDLRDFTTFTELRDPEVVIDVLNRFLAEMSDAILDHGGTLLRYEGDGILAVFGAPVEQPDHADRALAAVREMVGPRLAGFNDWLAAEHDGERFRIGIGLNSGRIISGNVGGERRLEYTVVGDTVNTASRIEAMTKDSPYCVLISDTTRAMLRHDAHDLRYVDAMPVRGKLVKANLWTLDMETAVPAGDATRLSERPGAARPRPAPGSRAGASRSS